MTQHDFMVTTPLVRLGAPSAFFWSCEGIGPTFLRPLLAYGATFRDRQREQIGVGGCSQRWQACQQRNRSWPTAPPCQKCSFSLVTCGCERVWNMGVGSCRPGWDPGSL